MTSNRQKLTVPEVAAAWGISESKILTWIRSGELRAMNIAASRCGRPRWRIDRTELERFEAARSNAAPVKIARTRMPRNDNVIEFYKR